MSQLVFNSLVNIRLGLKIKGSRKGRTCRISWSAFSRSSSRVKQWQWIIGIWSSYTSLRSRRSSTRIPRKASRNWMAESGRFITKCVIRFRGGLVSATVTFEIDWPSATSFCRRLRSFSSWSLLGLGPEQAGNGSSNTRDTIVRIKSRPSSHVTRTKSLTCKTL